MKIKKEIVPYHKRIKVTDSTLCCSINPEIQCVHCKALFCMDCGRAWSSRRHFIIDLCRTRFTKEEIKESNLCFKKRIVNGKLPRQLGNCKICTTRAKQVGPDRLFLDHLRKK